jgi:hypothetical protein
MMPYSRPQTMMSLGLLETFIRSSERITSDGKLVLLELIDLDSDEGTDDEGNAIIHPSKRVSVALVASGCGLPAPRTLIAMREVQRLGLASIEYVGGELDLRVTMHYDVIERFVRRVSSGGGPRGGGGGRGGGQLVRVRFRNERLRGTGSDGEVRIVPVDYLQSTSPTVESQHPEAA